ncbi:MAG: CCA-adding enzyme [Syntrophus sp. SKADARSKE-3]|nr:CCA-adding enzyme [Syntrophus sp. SKADARSKE-3]
MAAEIKTARELAADIVHRLREAGHEAYFVGGCVRDLVLGRNPGDYDIATSAHPDVVQQLFPVTIPVGVSFGVVLVVMGGKNHEVATYRTEDSYDDGRRPSHVSFSSLVEDVRRRDFTINGLALDPETGRIIDYVGGQADIRDRIIRTIGDPAQRFAEDHLRLLRAIRFSANLGFDMDPDTFAAIVKNASLIRKISAERIRDELTKSLTRQGARRAIELLHTSGLLREVLPEVEALRGVSQPPEFHPEGDVWEHTLRMVDGLLGISEQDEADHRLAWAVLLHDVGKAVTRSEDERGVHFYGHVEKGVKMADTILRRLKFSGADTETILALIANHMRFMNVRQMKVSTLKRFLRLPDFDLHLALHHLDCIGSHGMLDYEIFCRQALADLPVETLHPPRLLTGHDLKAMGFTAGPMFKEILRSVEDAQLSGEISTAEDARRWVLERFSSFR